MKTISVPLTKSAMHHLDHDECTAGDLEESSLSKEEFKIISKTGIFEIINNSLGTIIDEYEDENIQGLDRLAKSLSFFEEIFKETKIDKIQEIIELNKKAISKNTGLFFFF